MHTIKVFMANNADSFYILLFVTVVVLLTLAFLESAIRRAWFGKKESYFVIGLSVLFFVTTFIQANAIHYANQQLAVELKNDVAQIELEDIKFQIRILEGIKSPGVEAYVKDKKAELVLAESRANSAEKAVMEWR